MLARFARGSLRSLWKSENNTLLTHYCAAQVGVSANNDAINVSGGGEFHSVSARLEEDEHTRDGSREIAIDIMATSTTY